MGLVYIFTPTTAAIYFVETRIVHVGYKYDHFYIWRIIRHGDFFETSSVTDVARSSQLLGSCDAELPGFTEAEDEESQRRSF